MHSTLSGKFSPRNDQGLHWSFRRPVLSPFQLAGTKHRNHNMSAPIDFAIDLLQTAKTVGVTEVKDEDLFKGIAQNAVQLESALSNRKRGGTKTGLRFSKWRVIKKHRSCGYKLCEDVFSGTTKLCQTARTRGILWPIR
ncbi:unnamed protein product [Rhizophagus irregularis]|nr:unnamed protein product [Rhizophagus irregularis]